MPRHRPFVGMEIGWTRPLDRIAAYCVVAAQKVYEVKSLIIKEMVVPHDVGTSFLALWASKADISSFSRSSAHSWRWNSPTWTG